MLSRLPLVFLLALTSAAPKDSSNRSQFFGLPDAPEPDHSVDENRRSPASLSEHLDLGSEQDDGHFRKVWEAERAATRLFGADRDWDSLLGSGPKTAESNARPEVEESPSLEEDPQPEETAEELDVLPNIKIVKYQLPPLPEVKLPELPPMPEVDPPTIKLVKYQLPEMPQLVPADLPPLPEVKLPELKLIKYEFPPLPDWELPAFPEVPLPELPEIKLIKYELPAFPELGPVDLLPLPEMTLPELKLIQYELPDFPEVKMNFPPLPEFHWPDIKLIKFELPEVKPLEMKNLFPEVLVPKVKVPKAKLSSKSKGPIDSKKGGVEGDHENAEQLVEDELVTVDSFPHTPWLSSLHPHLETDHHDLDLVAVDHQHLDSSVGRDQRTLEASTRQRVSSKFTVWPKVR